MKLRVLGEGCRVYGYTADTVCVGCALAVSTSTSRPARISSSTV